MWSWTRTLSRWLRTRPETSLFLTYCITCRGRSTFCAARSRRSSRGDDWSCASLLCRHGRDSSMAFFIMSRSMTNGICSVSTASRRHEDLRHEFANAAIPELLFWRNRERTVRLLGPCRLVHAQKFGFLLYPLTGGFGYRSYVPKYRLRDLAKARGSDDATICRLADRDANDRGFRETRLNCCRGNL